jgi:hypothetical protein
MNTSTQINVQGEGQGGRKKEGRKQSNVPKRPVTREDNLADRKRLDFILIAVSVGAVLGLILLAPPFCGSSDLSQWAAVYSLAERGTYNIDKTPWPATVDRVQINGHFYSDKPPLLPTLLAGEYLLLKKLSFGRLSFRNSPDSVVRIILASINLVPLVIFLGLFSRLLDRLAPDPWIRAYTMVAAGLGTFLTGFSISLNNHTIAAFSLFFALYPAFLIWYEGQRAGWLFAVAGFFAGFAAANEYPTAAFLVALGAGLAWKARRQTLIWFLPFALLPIAGHFWTSYLVTGNLLPAYTHMDAISGHLVGKQGIYNIYEPWPVYLFHMVVGRQGIPSLSPIFIFTLMGVWSSLRSRGSPLRAFAALAALLTLVLVVFYTFFFPNRVDGGMSYGLRYLFCLIPLWLVMLPEGLRGKTTQRWFRGMALAFLLASGILESATISVWAHPFVGTPMPIDLGRAVKFNAQNPPRWQGWSGAEQWGTWSDGDSALVLLALSSIPKNELELLIDGSAFLTDKHPYQIVDILVNGHYVGTLRYDLHSNSGVRVVKIPKVLTLEKNGQLSIKFNFRNPKSPAALGLSDDTRRLGLGIASLELREEN